MTEAQSTPMRECLGADCPNYAELAETAQNVDQEKLDLIRNRCSQVAGSFLVSGVASLTDCPSQEFTKDLRQVTQEIDAVRVPRVQAMWGNE